MDNVLETVTVEQFPVIAQIKDFMKEHGAMNALMSGADLLYLVYIKRNRRHWPQRRH